jgi:hypothetical protein
LLQHFEHEGFAHHSGELQRLNSPQQVTEWLKNS